MYHCHSNSIQIYQKCNHFRTTSTAWSAGIREPVDFARKIREKEMISILLPLFE
jgi:hypothetical protein